MNVNNGMSILYTFTNTFECCLSIIMGVSLNLPYYFILHILHPKKESDMLGNGENVVNKNKKRSGI